jgi:hypothetical protein
MRPTIGPSRHGRLALLVALAALLAAGCRDVATGPDVHELIGLNLQAMNLDGQLALLVVEVTGAGQSEPIIGNFAFEDGTASGVLRVPLGQRTFVARAYHQEGFLTHQGSVTQTVRPGDSEVRIPLTPVSGDVTIEVILGAHSIEVTPGAVEAVVGDELSFHALVTGPDGNPDGAAMPIWGSSNIAVAEIDGTGTATAYLDGEAVIAASHEGVSATAVLSVRSPFRDFPVAIDDGSSEGQTAGAGTVFAAELEPGDETWPLRLHGYVSIQDTEPMPWVWEASVGLVVDKDEGGLLPAYTLNASEIPPDMEFSQVHITILGGRAAAVEAAEELMAELDGGTPDWVRVTELTEILIALMGGPTECPEGVCDAPAPSDEPTVVAVSPSDGATEAGVGSPLALTFNLPMDPSTLTGKTTLDAGPCTGTVQASTDGFATCIPVASGLPAMSGEGTVATFLPAPGLAFGSTFRVRVTEEAQTVDGVPLPSAFETAVGFTTALDDREEDRALNESGLALEADFCSVHHPSELALASGTESEPVLGRLLEVGLTDTSESALPQVHAQLGFGPRDRNPQWESGWTFVDADFNGRVGDQHEYEARVPPQAPGAFGYVYRFSLDEGGSWTYCDAAGSGSGEGLSFETPRIPLLTVIA